MCGRKACVKMVPIDGENRLRYLRGARLAEGHTIRAARWERKRRHAYAHAARPGRIYLVFGVKYYDKAETDKVNDTRVAESMCAVFFSTGCLPEEHLPHREPNNQTGSHVTPVLRKPFFCCYAGHAGRPSGMPRRAVKGSYSLGTKPPPGEEQEESEDGGRAPRLPKAGDTARQIGMTGSLHLQSCSHFCRWQRLYYTWLLSLF